MRKTFFTLIAIILFCCQFGQAQTPAAGRFPIGERLTYSITFATFPSAAFAETYVVSTGKYGERDAVYLQGRVKTTDFVNAAFFSIDETRQILVTPDTGLPLLSKVIKDENGMPREKVTDHKGPAGAHDWLSALFQLRFSATPSGVLNIQEDNGSIVQASYQLAGKAHIKTTAGEFDTVVIDVQNPSFPKMQVYLSDDERRIPVVVSYKHPKGIFRAELAGIQDLSPEPVAEATPRPQNTPPVVMPTPKPRATPLPYKNNQPLAEDLPFDLGETLTYRLSRPGAAGSFGTLVVQAAERKQFFGADSLLLSASVQQLTDSNSFFAAGDSIKSYVEPDTLLPQRTEINFHGALSLFNQMLQFDQATGKVTDGKGTPYDIPVGTHDILSLAYAIRSFNLKEVKPNKGPSGDIRVALFTSDGPVILTILSQPEEIIDFQGKKITAQVIFASIGQSTAKLWLSKDQDKLPLRINITSPTFAFNADLISVVQNPPPVSESSSSANVPGIPADLMKNMTVINPTMINPTLTDLNTVNAAPAPAIKKP
ncbi:MAG TPA: DUF3108 domain-containing protein [Pyrinomonadaceae bacterium]|jgi:hypothetical protein|nr:DUF3108 domain-containing protein [Pyrinomonadaceae bacterium]